MSRGELSRGELACRVGVGAKMGRDADGLSSWRERTWREKEWTRTELSPGKVACDGLNTRRQVSWRDGQSSGATSKGTDRTRQTRPGGTARPDTMKDGLAQNCRVEGLDGGSSKRPVASRGVEQSRNAQIRIGWACRGEGRGSNRWRQSLSWCCCRVTARSLAGDQIG